MEDEIILDSLLQTESFEEAGALLNKEWFPRYNRLKRRPRKRYILVATNVEVVMMVGFGTISISFETLGYKIDMVSGGTIIHNKDGALYWAADHGFKLKEAVEYIHEHPSSDN